MFRFSKTIYTVHTKLFNIEQLVNVNDERICPTGISTTMM